MLIEMFIRVFLLKIDFRRFLVFRIWWSWLYSMAYSFHLKLTINVEGSKGDIIDTVNEIQFEKAHKTVMLRKN